MTEKKYDTLLKGSLGVLAISAVMLCVSGYNVYFRHPQVAAVKDSGARAVRDSLQKVYTATIKNLDRNFAAARDNVDTLSADLDVKLNEFNKLRTDITDILQDESSDADLGAAKQKIEELQQRVSLLRTKNTDVEKENRRLQAILEQLISTGGPKMSAAVKAETKKVLQQNPEGMAATGLHLAAVSMNNNKETETTAAEDARKIIGSFSLLQSDDQNTEFLVVVTQPDGKVIRNSVWESGVFETKEGKKVYSRKIYVDPQSNEKQVNFTLNPDRFLKGEYTMQIWCNGRIIGKMSRVLS